MEETSVRLAEAVGEETISLSTLDQQAQRNYANFLLMFKLYEGHSGKDVIGKIKHGLSVALSEIPDFASTVSPSQGSLRNELELRLGPESAVPLKIVDHAASAGSCLGNVSQPALAYRTYGDLAGDWFPLAGIPVEALFYKELAPDQVPPDGTPALVAQINVVEGGLIMGLSWHHTVCDARAMSTFLRHWAHHTRASVMQGASSDATVVPPSESTRDRWRLLHGSEHVSITRFPDYQVDSAARAPLPPLSSDSSARLHLFDRQEEASADTDAVFSTWYFSHEALRLLRNLLGDAAAENGEMMHFTNSEAASALVWKHLSQARLLHQMDGQGSSLFSTRVDFRARTKPAFDDDYIGNINEPNAQTRMSLGQVCVESSPQSLALLAKVIREAVASLDEKAMRDFIGLVDSLPAVTDLAWDYNTLPGPDLVVTDMNGLDLLQHDWGTMLGTPQCIRSASREKGVAYFLPQDAEGGFEVQLQCEAEAVDRLRRDAVFTGYAQFRC